MKKISFSKNFLSYLICLLYLCADSSFFSDAASGIQLGNCNFDGAIDRQKAQKDVLSKLGPLLNRSFAAVTFEVEGRTYTFNIGLCEKACSDCEKNVGVLQSWEDDGHHEKVVGRMDDVVVVAGKYWIMLTYPNGDKYKTHCTVNKNRKANIMFLCDPSKSNPDVRVLEENYQSNKSCYYLIEVSTKHACPPSNSILPEGVSGGSVLVILFVVAVSCYLIIGCIYQRFVVGAKGIEQIPNIRAWQGLGNLMADGCDFVFRTKNPRTGSQRSAPGAGGGYTSFDQTPNDRAYKGLGDNILSNSESNGGLDGGGDDSMLPM